MEKIATIKDLYFNQEKNLTDISKIVKTSISYISKILRQDQRYNAEKEKRKQQNLAQRRKIQKEAIYKNRRTKNDIEYARVIKQHENASKELSKHSILGNDTLRKWCTSAYKYNSKKHRYEFDTENLLKPSDFPAYIKV